MYSFSTKAAIDRFSYRFLGILLFLIFLQIPLFAQVGISNTPPDPSAVLDLNASDKGLLIPRMTTAQRTGISSPATGLLVFDTSTGGFWYYTGTAWTSLSAAASQLADADGNTKVQVEKNPNEDIIRFDLGGTETMVLRKNASGNTILELPSPISNTFIGQNAGAALTTGFYNTGNGRGALQSNTTGNSNTANGAYVLFSNTTGNSNTANGASALYYNTVGNNNTANGVSALSSNTTGSSNTANGASALSFNTTGNNNTANGESALLYNSTGNNNTANGTRALFSNTTGVFNTANGATALYSNTVGNNNTANGGSALQSNTTGNSNTANGAYVLFSNTTGSSNSANGANALYSNTTGNSNTANGGSALYSNTVGNNNTAYGVSALYSNTGGNDNSANGERALFSNTTGSSNTANGASALYSNTTGNSNTANGFSAGPNTGDLNNTTAIGNSATVNTSNKIRLGNTSVTVIEGQVAYSYPSDARFKFNVQDKSVPGLAFITRLRPVTYQFDTRKLDEHLFQTLPDTIRAKRLSSKDYSASTALVQTGFLAQEVEQVTKELGFDFSGLHVPVSPTDNYSLAYSSFVPVIVKAIQEQQTQFDTQQQSLSNLLTHIDHPVIKLENPADWSDKVFGPQYRLRPLSEVASFIETNHHLPEIPSAQEMTDTGLELVKLNALLLKKIEELTLYQIEQEKKLNALMSKMESLEKEK